MSGKIVELRVEDLREHEAMNLVPEMQEDEWLAFLEDVRQRGVTEPIVVCKNVVIDGRHRLRANRELFVETIPARQLDLNASDQLAYLLKAALLRRHLDAGQRAMVAARLKPHFEAAAKERMEAGKGADGSGGRGNKKNPVEHMPQGLAKTRDQVGAALSVSGKAVDAAEKVVKNAIPEIVKLADEGKVGVTAAAAVADLPKREQKKIVKEGAEGVKAAAKEQREKKKISGGATFDVAEIEEAQAADEAAKPQNPQEQMEATSERFDAILNHLKQAKTIATKLASEEVTGAWLAERWASAKVEFDNLWTTFSALKPGVLCPRCKGTRCDYCKKTGHMTASFARQRKGA